MPPRYFTLEEANRAVAELRPVVEQLVEHRRRFREAENAMGLRRAETALEGHAGSEASGSLVEAGVALLGPDDEHA